MAAFEDLASAMLALGRERELLPELARIAGDNPGRESLVGLHMQALYQAGRRVDALDVFARARTYLADELGIDPGPGLRGLHQAILRDEVGATKPVARSPEPRLVQRVIPRQLPTDVAGFAGHVSELERLDRLPQEARNGATSVVISAIRGVAGVGKTALAVHWAHRVADYFPDGQLYLNLRGFDPATSPLDPAEAVRSLLDGLQVPAREIPVGMDAQVGRTGASPVTGNGGLYGGG